MRWATLAACVAAAVTLAVGAAAPSAAEPAAFHPCDWVTVDEASALLGVPVQATAWGDEAGSSDLHCAYTSGPGDIGMQSDLRLHQSFPLSAAAQFGLATGNDSTPVDGLGVPAQCVYEPTTTPPSTTVVVLLSGERLYRATSLYGTSCDQLKKFAQIAIDRIGA
jgi:hypothetical protein